MSRVQVLLTDDSRAPVVAGLPSSVRTAFRAGKELAPERVVVAGAGPAYFAKWAFQFRAAGAPAGPDGAVAGVPSLRVAADAFPDEGGLKAFLSAAEPLGAARRVLDGRVVAEYARDGAFRPDAPAVEAGAFFDAATPASADAARRVLYARMTKDNDGYIARFDRRLSLALTTLMLPFPVSPNAVTAASLLIGLLGAWWLAAPSAARQFAGAATLWFCALLDGCDGEIARLKHHITPGGGDFDLAADHVAHLVTFIALPVGVARLHPGQDWLWPGLLLVTGFLACGYAVWALVLRVPEAERGPSALLVERVASRDYVYLILLFTALGRLDWFVWAAAVGSHAFWPWLWWTARAERL